MLIVTQSHEERTASRILKITDFWTLSTILFLYKYVFRGLDSARFLKSFIKCTVLIALIYYHQRLLDRLNSSCRKI